MTSVVKKERSVPSASPWNPAIPRDGAAFCVVYSAAVTFDAWPSSHRTREPLVLLAMLCEHSHCQQCVPFFASSICEHLCVLCERGLSTPETNWNSSRIEWKNCHTFQWQFACSIWANATWSFVWMGLYAFRKFTFLVPPKLKQSSRMVPDAETRSYTQGMDALWAHLTNVRDADSCGRDWSKKH